MNQFIEKIKKEKVVEIEALAGKLKEEIEKKANEEYETWAGTFEVED